MISRRSHDEFLDATLPALDLVYNLARRMVRDPDHQADLVQETFLRAFEAWTKGRKPRKVEPWIATICLNAGRSYWRKASVRNEVSVDEIPAEGGEALDVEELAIEHLQRRAVHDALWKLPEQQRIAITLMDLGGFTALEVARITRSPRGTVLARVHRGRKKLAEIIRQEVSRLET
jgi:RNA polymerase sigma-70 factor (ECF subfamily)